MISEEKMVHIVHLIIDGVWKEDLVDYSDEDLALKEAKKVALTYLKHLGSASDAASQRIRTQKSPPMEHSPQWENLYQKYFEEEWKKRGG